MEIKITKDLRRKFKAILNTISKDSLRNFGTVAFLGPKKGRLVLAGTDGYMLTIADIDCTCEEKDCPCFQSEPISLPYAFVETITKLKDKDIEKSLFINTSHSLVTCGNTEVTVYSTSFSPIKYPEFSLLVPSWNDSDPYRVGEQVFSGNMLFKVGKILQNELDVNIVRYEQSNEAVGKGLIVVYLPLVESE